MPMTVGSKLNCDQIQITCHYFFGDIRLFTATVPTPSSSAACT